MPLRFNFDQFIISVLSAVFFFTTTAVAAGSGASVGCSFRVCFVAGGVSVEVEVPFSSVYFDLR